MTTGNCHPNTGGHPAIPVPDLAMGTGLADAFRAALIGNDFRVGQMNLK